MIVISIVSFCMLIFICIYSSALTPIRVKCGENAIYNNETQQCECIDCYTKDENGECTICTEACESMYYAGKRLCVSKVPQDGVLREDQAYGFEPFEIKTEIHSNENQGFDIHDIKAANNLAEKNFHTVAPYFKNDTGEVYRLNRSLLPKPGKDYSNDWKPQPQDTTGIPINNYRSSLNLAHNSLGLNNNQTDLQLTEFANGDIMDEYQPITELHRPYTKKPLEVWGTHYEKENSRVLNGRNEVPGPYSIPIIDSDKKLENLEFSLPLVPGSTIPEPNNNRNKLNLRLPVNHELKEHAKTYMGHAHIETSADDIMRQAESKEVRERVIPSLLGPLKADHITEPYVKYQSKRDLSGFNLKAKGDLPDTRYPLVNANNEAKPHNSLRDVKNYTTIFDRDFSQTRQPYTNNNQGLKPTYDASMSIHENIKNNNSHELIYNTLNYDMGMKRDYYAEKNNKLKTGLPTVMG